MRILVSFEPAYHAYQGVIAASIQVLRPHTEVETTTPETLGETIERLDPEIVICNRPNTVDPNGRVAWVELSLDSIRPSKICLGGRHVESTNPTLKFFLKLIHHIHNIINTHNHPYHCYCNSQ